METRTETLDLALPDGTTVDAIVARPTAEGTWPGVLVWMDAFGLRPRLEEMAAHVAAQGHLVLVPNLYHRRGRAPVTPLRDLRTEAGRSEAFKELMPLMRTLTPQVVAHDASAYVDLLRDLAAREAHLRHAEPSGNLRADLVAELDAFRHAISDDSLGEMVIAVGQLARHDPELAELQADLRTAGSAVLTEVLRDAVARGELPGSTDLDALIARLVGPVLYAHLLGPLDQCSTDFVADVVDAVLAAVRADLA